MLRGAAKYRVCAALLQVPPTSPRASVAETDAYARRHLRERRRKPRRGGKQRL